MMKIKQKIEKLTLRKFRGATTETIVTFGDKKNVLLFGENGTGKSTIIDAIDFVCNQDIGSLNDISSTKAKQHLPAIGNEIKDVWVELVSGGKVCIGRHSGSKVIVEGDANLPPVRVLRRSKLLKLVEAPPSKRYEEIQSFIDVGNIERCEQTLRETIKESDANLSRYLTIQSETEASLVAFRQGDLDDGRSIIDWAKTKIEKDIALSKVDLSKLKKIIESFSVFTNSEKRYDLSVSEFESAKKETEVAKAAFETNESERNFENAKLIELLRNFESIISKPYSKNECPACLSGFDADELRKQTAERRENLKLAESLHNSFEEKKKQQLQKETIYKESSDNLVKTAEVFAKNTIDIGFTYEELTELEQETIERVATSNGKFTNRDDRLNFSKITAEAYRVTSEKHDALQKEINEFDLIGDSYRRYVEAVS